MNFTAAEIKDLCAAGLAVRFHKDGTVALVSPVGSTTIPLTGAQRARRHRQKRNGSVTVQTENVTKSNASNEGVIVVSSPTPPPSAHTGPHTPAREADAEIYPEACTIAEARQMAENAGIPKEAAEAWWYDHDKRGWIDKQGHRVRNARSSIVAFGRQWQSFEAKQAKELEAKRNAVTQRVNGTHKAQSPSDPHRVEPKVLTFPDPDQP